MILQNIIIVSVIVFISVMLISYIDESIKDAKYRKTLKLEVISDKFMYTLVKLNGIKKMENIIWSCFNHRARNYMKARV